MTQPPVDAITEHGRECEPCRADAATVAAALARSRVPVEAGPLSARVLAAAVPQLEARARAVFWRRLTRALAAALVPLPMVIVADLWVLGVLHAIASAWLPDAVATYLVVSYAATLVVLLGSAYAAIPLLLARPLRPAGVSV